MTTTPIRLQDLRRKLYAKAKAEAHWRFWGLYVHVCKMETLREAYAMAKANDGAPGSDGVTFEAIEERGVEGFLAQIQGELSQRTYVPLRARKKEIPKEGSNKVRILSIPCIRDRVVQGALKLCGTDLRGRLPTWVVWLSSQAHSPSSANPRRWCDRNGQDTRYRYWSEELFWRSAARSTPRKSGAGIQDDDVMHLLKIMLKANGKQGVPQGGVISPVLSNLYLGAADQAADLKGWKSPYRQLLGFGRLAYPLHGAGNQPWYARM
jgi:RNA-directed DNA polymerase